MHHAPSKGSASLVRAIRVLDLIYRFGEEATGLWNLLVLERLVNDRGDEFPDRRDEWASYLYFLREYAAPDGTVPSSFDGLIQETFSELVP